MSSKLAASALSWWRDAGVDVIVGETPRDWLNPAAVAPSEAPPPAPTLLSPAPAPSPFEPIPATLDRFREWLLESPNVPGASPSVPRIGPSGDPASDLMVLVDMPSAQDVTGGKLLSGEAGALFDRMIEAMFALNERTKGRGRSAVYLASLSPARTATGRLEPDDARRLADIARHHIGLVAPRALLLFGDTCAKALTGMAVAHARGRWHETETKAGKIKTLVTIRPEKLMTQPALKKLAWEDLQRLMEGYEP
ncbi:uracil-DNA glycosylase family protein [Sphingosinicella sp. CPCC 101087]|uniref:uracil-DNA glycosylase family protein n=1 Tax=Sphingosinicella sp. CPCC 101087 TaxID=2497754 RepID=UPI00101DAC07|nr:uracil-DNA glycosylase family protein [Sphingosinicella sp. CPCC 101087]